MMMTRASARDLAGILVGESLILPRHRDGWRGGAMVATLESAPQGRLIDQIAAILLRRDQFDARPPGVCVDCYGQWSNANDGSHIIACPHRGAIAVLMPMAIRVAPGRYIGRLAWHVSSNLVGLCSACWHGSLWALLLPNGPTSVRCAHNGTALVLTPDGWERAAHREPT